jgi:uncharacterized protein YjgD (DUF1641 family)
MEPDLARKLDDLDHRLQRLESTLSAFGRLADRIERIEAAVDLVGTLAERLPVLTDAAGAGVAFAVDTAKARGVDPVSTGLRAGGLALDLMSPANLDVAEKLLAPANVAAIERLAAPENLALLEKLAARRPLVEKLLAATDGVDEAAVVDVAQRSAAMAGRLSKLLANPALARLLDAAAADKVLDTAEHATTALVEARSQKPAPVGLFGALGKMGDSDVKRAVGFTLALAKRFGQLLDR